MGRDQKLVFVSLLGGGYKLHPEFANKTFVFSSITIQEWQNVFFRHSLMFFTFFFSCPRSCTSNYAAMLMREIQNAVRVPSACSPKPTTKKRGCIFLEVEEEEEEEEEKEEAGKASRKYLRECHALFSFSLCTGVLQGSKEKVTFFFRWKGKSHFFSCLALLLGRRRS